MTRKRSIVSAVASSRAGDDFKLIHGIGPVTEKCLHEAGVYRFADLAKLNPEDVASLLPNVSANQVHSQGWILQAGKLSKRNRESASRRKLKSGSPSRQHYENFTLEFLLDEKNRLRRLRVTHVQSGDVDTWTVWNPDEISNFLARHTGARFQHAARTPPAKSTAEHSPSLPAAKQADSIIPTEIKLQDTASSAGSKHVMNQIRLLEWLTALPNSRELVRNVPSDQRFDVSLKLDISSITHSERSRFDLTGMLRAKKLGTSVRELIGETRDVVPFAPILNLNIHNVTLPQGVYRLEAQIKLNQIEPALPPASIDTFFEGGLLQVY